MASPLRIGAIDIGSNGIRFIVADVEDPESFEVIHKDRAAVRLGHHTFTQGHLDPDVAGEAVAALKRFRAKADELGVHRMRVVATSAVREAEDCQDFLRAVRRTAKLRIEVIDGKEEARLVHRAVRDRLPWGDKPWLVMDLGGGSLEIALSDRNRIHWSESRRIGTVRLLEKHASHADGPSMAARIHDDVDGFQFLHSADGLDIGGIAATGGNINELARMDGARPRNESPHQLAIETLARLRAGMEAQTVEERIAAHGFRPDRADVIVPAAIVFERVAALAGGDAIHVPGWGVREGVVLDLMDDHFGDRAEQDPQDELLEDHAVSLGRALRFDEDHAEHVARLALALFDQTADLHGLKPKDRRTLHAAALLHDVGRAIGEANHNVHSQYIIEHSELPSLTEKQTHIAAAVARYHRGPEPMDHDHRYRLFGRKARSKIMAMSALLRIANALDTGGLQAVRRLSTDIQPTVVDIRLKGRSSLDEARAAALEHGSLFEATFHRKLTIGVP